MTLTQDCGFHYFFPHHPHHLSIYSTEGSQITPMVYLRADLPCISILYIIPAKMSSRFSPFLQSMQIWITLPSISSRKWALQDAGNRTRVSPGCRIETTQRKSWNVVERTEHTPRHQFRKLPRLVPLCSASVLLTSIPDRSAAAVDEADFWPSGGKCDYYSNGRRDTCKPPRSRKDGQVQ